jgi:hypothetical protein
MNNIEKKVGDLTVLFIWLSFLNVNDIAGEERKNENVKDYVLKQNKIFRNYTIC